MRLLTSQCFFLTLLTVSFICSIILQCLFPLFFQFFCFYFTFFFLICSPRYTFNNLALMFNSISLQHPHSTVRFHYNTPKRKYLLNCKQRFKTRKEMMRKKKYNPFKKHFSSTTPRYYKYIGKNVFRS